MMKLHIAAGVDVNLSNFDNRTPIMCAISHNVNNKNCEMVNLLCSTEGINLEAVDLFGNTALQYAQQNGDPVINDMVQEALKKKQEREKEKQREKEKKKEKMKKAANSSGGKTAPLRRKSP